MRIPLDRRSKIPLYQQIETYFRQAIFSSSLLPDTRLPATRELAHDLGVNRITVETAYAELEADGLIFRRVGSGAYVLPPGPGLPTAHKQSGAVWPEWQQALLADPHGANLQPGDDFLQATGHSDLIDLAGGLGDPHLFPVDDFRKGIQAVMRRDGPVALEYGERCGYGPLRETIARVLASQGLQARPENILMTAGSQQALALVTQLLTSPGNVVLVESPTYSGILDLFRAARLQVVGIPTDENGMQVARLEELLRQHHPRLIYTIPNFQNPSGVCLSGQRRRQLIALADRYQVPIVEDDFVGDLRYDGRAQPALKALDPGGRVIYVSTFSKMLMPGLRVGFLTADGPVFEALVNIKRVNDLATSNLIQHALEAYVTVGRYQAHLRRSCQIYRKRRDALLQGIQRFLPAEVRVHPPQGGLFAWLRLPEGWSAEELLIPACRQGIAFAPGRQFFPNQEDGKNCLRLNFASQPPETIEEGLRRLGKAMDYQMPGSRR